MLTLTNIRKSYGRKTVLDGITQGFPIGLTLLIGPSGAGKSTLLRLLATAEKPNAGTMSWNGATLPGARAALRQTLGYAPQAVDLRVVRLDDAHLRDAGTDHIQALLVGHVFGGEPRILCRFTGHGQHLAVSLGLLRIGGRREELLRQRGGAATTEVQRLRRIGNEFAQCFCIFVCRLF